MRGVAGAAGVSTDYGPEGISARADLARATLAELDAVSPDRAGGARSGRDEAAARVLRGRLLAELAAVEIGEPLRAVRAPFGLLATVRDSIDLMPKDGADDWAAVAARMAAIPRMLSSWRDALALRLDPGPAGRRPEAPQGPLHGAPCG